MYKSQKYVGVHNDRFGGMTGVGKIVRDAWVFGFIPETETCEGWEQGRIDALKEQVNQEWDKYACLVSQLPEELFERHKRIYAEAVTQAKEAGWSGEQELQDDD
jgi:hypothetical protein